MRSGAHWFRSFLDRPGALSRTRIKRRSRAPKNVWHPKRTSCVNGLDSLKSCIVASNGDAFPRCDSSNMSKLLIRSKFGVSAALFALLIQFVASFGHVHSEHLRLQPVALELALAVHPGGIRVSKPFDTDSDGHLADICDVCATLNLIASGRIAAPPALPTRIASCESEMLTPAGAVPAGVRHLNFRSRAPPFA